MRRYRLLVALVVMVVAGVACVPSDVEARDYDQTCAKDDDCVRVTELLADGTDCSIGCTWNAINKKEKAQYDQDLADSRRHCGSVGSPFCEDTGVAVCAQGRCEVKR